MVASEALSIIPAAVLRNLADKLYEKRKYAALEIEGIVKQLAQAGEHEKIASVISLLTTEFTYSPQANHRKGGLIGLAAATVGLTAEAAQHLEQIVPPVLNSFLDQDNRVRYYTCEALYNIEKNVDYGRMAEILVQRAGSPDEFTRLTSIIWINEFVKLGGDQLIPYYADILGAILPCISDKEEKIRVVARETNKELRNIRADPSEGFDIGAILSIARRQLTSKRPAADSASKSPAPEKKAKVVTPAGGQKTGVTSTGHDELLLHEVEASLHHKAVATRRSRKRKRKNTKVYHKGHK